jgi:hypothetical protein
MASKHERYITQLKLMVDIANAVGSSDDASSFQNDALRSSKAFVQAYLRPTSNGSAAFSDGALTAQAANALALELFPEADPLFGTLLSKEQRSSAVAALVQSVLAADGHSITGIIGQRALYPLLSALSTKPTQVADLMLAGMHANAMPSGSMLALTMMTKTDFPSVGYEIAQGATTLWEKYGGAKGTTRNHIMFGTFGAWYYSSLAGIQVTSSSSRRGGGGGGGGGGKGGLPVGSWLQNLVLKPRISCEYLASSTNLSSISASFASPVGMIRSSWEIVQCPSIPNPTPNPPASTCDIVLEKDTYQNHTTGVLELACGAGSHAVIDKIEFAEFGIPTGNCVTGFVHGNETKCQNGTSGNAKAAVGAACLGKASCSVKVSVHVFGDPCLNVPKRLAVNVSCAPSPSSPSPPLLSLPSQSPVSLGPRHVVWNISIPVGASANVFVPLLGADAGKVTIAVDGCTSNAGDNDEGGQQYCTVWRRGNFVPQSVPGVSSSGGSAIQDDSVQLQFASGDYSIVLRDDHSLQKLK